jgi:aerobic carbon-monoxide dehydrogenase small subunit
MDQTFKFTVNGQQRSVTTDPDRPLVEVLREDLGLTGPKLGCGEGQCGACTVLMDGKTVFSCTTPVSDAQGQTIVTIEGLASGDKLHPVQEAFLAEGAMQCGYCTPGMIMAAAALLKETPNPTDTEIRSGMEKHLCRCNGYHKIENAVKRAALAGRQTP